MSAAKFDVTIEQGASFQKTLTLKDGAGVALNLTNYLVRSQIRKQPKSHHVVVDFDVTIILPATDGKVLWKLSATASDGIDVSGSNGFDPLEYYYDLEIEAPSGLVTRILQGAALIVPNVTRAET